MLMFQINTLPKLESPLLTIALGRFKYLFDNKMGLLPESGVVKTAALSYGDSFHYWPRG